MGKRKKTIVIATGGTGGHIFPAKALAAQLRKRDYNVVFMSDTRSLSYLCSVSSVVTIPSASPSGGVLKKVKALWSIPWGIVVAMYHLIRIRPEAVVGFGGYPSFPTLIAAILLGKRTMVHEQNAVLGRVNKSLAAFVKVLALSFDKTRGIKKKYKKKLVLTGNPVREDIRAIYKIPYPKYKKNTCFEVLVLGGSQGATSLSKIVPEAICALPESYRKKIRVTQQCREADIDSVEKKYQECSIKHELATFFDNVPEHIAKSHLVISRSGASTLAEVTVAGRPSVLFPYPYAMDDHQTANALCLVENSAAIVIPENDIRPSEVTETLKGFLDSPEKLVDMAIHAFEMGIVDADSRLADSVEALVDSKAA
jgi:UDP-N-acetylglucosamine--N-acetylmuramyl-(pentapeptide) pyrophosphoryl-undecaprenol N-acetylglucosamine transferase